MKITLANLPNSEEFSPNLDLLMLASVVEKQGYTPEVKDLNFLSQKHKEKTKGSKLLSTVEETRPDLLVVDNQDLTMSVGFLRKYKQLHPETTTLICGRSKILSRSLMESFPFVDLVLVNEKEATFKETVDFFRRFKTKENPDFWRNHLTELRNIRGIFFRESDENEYQIVNTEDRDHIKNLDELPFAAHHLIPKLKEYHKIKYGKEYKDFDVEGFLFATRSGLNNTKRYRSPLHISTEIRSLINNQKVKKVNFKDNFTLADKTWMKDLIGTMKKLDLSWSCDSKTKILNEDLSKSMSESKFNEGITFERNEIPLPVVEYLTDEVLLDEISKVLSKELPAQNG